jgi:hypothetical protein
LVDRFPMRWSMTSRGTHSRTLASKRALIRGAP